MEAKMQNMVRIDVREFYHTARECLEECTDVESDMIDGLCRAVAGLKRLIGTGQSTLIIPIGNWLVIAEAIEAEANRIDNSQRARSRRFRTLEQTPSWCC